MWQSYKFESLNPEKYEEVRLSNDGLVGQWHCGNIPFPFDRKPSQLHDSALWNEFGKVIDELLSNLNKNFLPIALMTPVLILTALAVGLGMEQDAVVVAIAVGVVALLAVGCMMRIVKRNQDVDKKIKETCAKYKGSFQEHGIVPVYRTRWTAMCKPKGARPLRLIVFIPSGDQEA